MIGRLRMTLGIVVLAAAVAGSPTSLRAQDGTSIAPGAGRMSADPAAQEAHGYLSQSLSALAWARRYAESAAHAGAPGGFDLVRYRAELDTVIDGLERYLRPEGPPRGPLTEVEITGQFLLEGLRGRIPDGSGEATP